MTLCLLSTLKVLRLEGRVDKEYEFFCCKKLRCFSFAKVF
jgi:hypothetical protein